MEETNDAVSEVQTSEQRSPRAYVGIGASAGGLEATGSFFSELPADTGCTFIVVQHLSPDHKSLMSELLGRYTDMPVSQAEDGQVTEVNHVYLIPPKHNMTIFHGRLLLSEQDRSGGINLPIDVFLHSLATDQRDEAIAIILSGTGSDGVRGLRSIKEQGGLILVQDPDSARFDGMPKSAEQTGLADLVAAPEQLAFSFTKFLSRDSAGRLNLSVDPSSVPESTLSRIFSILRSETGVDFSGYKPSTVLRRLERRVLVNHLTDLDAYLKLLKAEPNEARDLYREFLIGVTRFFRDDRVFDALREGLLSKQLLQTEADAEMRVWVAGCSTGEEAYSLAILLEEARLKVGSETKVRIFATDVDQSAIETAQQGIYHDSITADVPPEYLSRYFRRCQGGFKILRSIREMVIFAKHNLLNDPPFTQMDMVTCRNVLIYFQSNIQQHVLESFSFALRHGGILMLGTSETVGPLSENFSIIDAQHKLYRSTGRKMPNLSTYTARPRDQSPSGTHLIPRQARPELSARLLDRMFSVLASESLPLTICVNEMLEVLQ